ncbi:MAG: hypothetical protein FNP40_07675 [Dehalobacter sp. 4CP]|uniref:hypothetical protein n=1 Tax=Dehalobacter sp. CP TaxID=2594474 RepID=UPI0013CC47B3|nr:hypothetical protein [Dehalobacter sp. 4CP]
MDSRFRKIAPSVAQTSALRIVLHLTLAIHYVDKSRVKDSEYILYNQTEFFGKTNLKSMERNLRLEWIEK